MASVRCNVLASLLVAVALCAGALTAVRAADTGGFSFHSFMQGEWKLEKVRTSMISKVHLEETTQFLFIDPSNVTDSLSGVLFENDTDTGSRINVQQIHIEMESEHSGLFQYSDVPAEPEEDEDHEDDPAGKTQKTPAAKRTWFAFEFATLQSNYVVSTGPLGDRSGYYQLTVTAKDKFVLTIFNPKADEPEITNIIATKVPKPAQSGFLQRNGMMIMIGCVFLFNMWVQRKTRARRPVFHQPMQRNAQEPQQQDQAGEPQPAEEKEGARIEELDENEQPVDPNRKKTN